VESVCAVVVTYNRRELLARCLGAVAAQTRPVEELLVVDNASTDDTRALVGERFPQATLLALESNLGGAGGFHAGMERAYAGGHAWLWLMDDDTIPEPDALETLLAGAERAPADAAILVSRALWKDGSPHPMNRPLLNWRRPGEMALAARHGLVGVRTASFVSLLARREAIDRGGHVLAEYFIWGDDFEWTARVLRDAAGYLVPESRVVHWTPRAHTAVTAADGARFYYHVRNSLRLLRGTSLRPFERVSFGRYWLGTLHRYLAGRGWSREALAAVARGLRDGVRGEAR
jgi:GT2 family glycosyltransferase